MQQVSKGDTIKVHYTGKFENGEQFDSSIGREPLEFMVGSGSMIPGFDKGVEGMVVAENRTIHVKAADGYGERHEENIIPFPKANFPEGVTPEIGQELTMQSSDGMPIEVIISDIQDDVVYLDANHFLAGHDLVFDIQLVEIL